MDEFDLDRTTEVGWASFLSRLADHLSTLTRPLTMAPLGGEVDGSPVVEVRPDEGVDESVDDGVDERPAGAADDGGTDDGTADTVLHAQLRRPAGPSWPDEERARHLAALGWTAAPGHTAYRLDLPRSHAHLLAAVLTDTLREVVGVPHPALLDAGELTIAAPPEGRHDGEDEGAAPAPPELDLDRAVRVRTPAELRTLVDATLHVALGHPPRHDHDGDVPILFGSALVYVRTADAQPVVTVFAIPVQDITDLDAARREVEIFNRRAVFGKLHLVGRQLVASVAIPCLPFVPRHLVGMVELLGSEIDRMDEDLATRVRGRRWVDLLTGTGPAGEPLERPGPAADAGPDGARADGAAAGGAAAGGTGADGTGAGPDGAPHAEDEALPPELETLLQLTAEGAPVAPAVVAEVCHHDRDLLLRLIRLAEEQTISWRASVREARGAGDADAARAAADEMRGWSRTVRDLRAALRHVVTFGGPAEG